MTFAPPLTGGAKVMRIIIKRFIKGRMILTPSKQLITPLHDFFTNLPVSSEKVNKSLT
jgi:hypothetical protein